MPPLRRPLRNHGSNCTLYFINIEFHSPALSHPAPAATRSLLPVHDGPIPLNHRHKRATGTGGASDASLGTAADHIAAAGTSDTHSMAAALLGAGPGRPPYGSIMGGTAASIDYPEPAKAAQWFNQHKQRQKMGSRVGMR